MLKNFGQKANQFIKKQTAHAGDFIGEQIEQRGAEKTGQWVKEATKGVGSASGASVELASTAAEGIFKVAKGIYSKEEHVRDAGVDDMKDAAKTVGKSFVSVVKHTTSSVYETGAGIATKDYERMRAGLWKGSQIAVVAIAAVGVVDFIDGGDVVLAESLNDHFEGEVHPVTGVPFERTEIEFADETISGVYPVFDSEFTAQLQTNEYTLSDTQHEKIANAQLYAAIEQNPSLQYELHMTTADVQALLSNETPAGYTWHHHEQPGQIQLVESSVHDQTAHTGGRHIWGGGTEAR